MAEADDLAEGRCYVLLNDRETWDEADGCIVRFSTQAQADDQEWGDPIVGYRDISVGELIRHYLETKG